MKQYEFDPSAEGFYRDSMLEGYRECRQQRPESEAQKKAAQAGKTPTRRQEPAVKPEKQEPSVRQKRERKPDCKPKAAPSVETTPAFAESLETMIVEDPYGDSRLGRLDKAIKKLVIDIDLKKDKEVKKDLEQKLQKLRENRMKVIEKEGVEG